MEWEDLPAEPEHCEVCEAENVSLKVEDLYDFDPDTCAFLEGRPHGDREGSTVGFVHDAIDDSGGEQ